MAVIEIARIQVRRGQENQTGVPQLAGGEFAWAADTEKLYIGLTREDGGSRDANVEILTENSLRNLFEPISSLTSATTYTYRPGTYITAEDGVNEVVRTVQDKLDDLGVTIKDFDIIGDNFNDNTAKLQVAIDNLFLNALGLPGDPGRELKIPPGIYRISETIFIPKNTRIIGEGPDRTIIRVASTGCHAFQTCDSDSAGGLSGYITFDNTSTINSNTQPDNVYIENLSIEYDTTETTVTQTLSLLSLDCSNNAIIRNVKFKGNYGYDSSTSTNHTGIEIRGYQSVTSENVLIENCQFENLCFGIRSNYDILNPQIQNSKFNELYKGIAFNDPLDPLAFIGPRFGRIMNNRFENISAQAIFVGSNVSTTSTHHASIGNQFINVGNGIYFRETTTTATSVITYDTSDNWTINDYYDRYEFNLNNESLSGLIFHPLVQGNSNINLSSARVVNVPPSTNVTAFIFPLNLEKQFLHVRYNVYGLDVDRCGTLEVNIARSVSPFTPPDISITDNYNFNTASDGAITWLSQVDTSLKKVKIIIQHGLLVNLTLEHNANLLI